MFFFVDIYLLISYTSFLMDTVIGENYILPLLLGGYQLCKKKSNAVDGS